jgi:predicted RNase H-like HicB family nuclease
MAEEEAASRGGVTMKRAIEVVFFRETDQWVAQALNVEVSSFGESLDEARLAIREALELYFEDEPDAEIPQASDICFEEVVV